MILLQDILLDEKILTQPFACDVKKCKGACCTLTGGAGAPLLAEEVPLIELSVESALPYLSERSATYIATRGWMEVNGNEFATACINNRDCVFVFYEDTVAKCALEKAYFDGNSTFRKPISCHLFPIRVTDFGGTYLYYEKISECKDAIVFGKEKQETVLDCAHDALIRMFGNDWVEAATTLSEKERR